jgi:hypothetical protein
VMCVVLCSKLLMMMMRLAVHALGKPSGQLSEQPSGQPSEELS